MHTCQTISFTCATSSWFSGTDHRTHYFEVLRDAADPTRLFVYFGMALVEKIPDDKNDPQYRLLLARLYNAGARPSALHTAFGIDGKTLRRWGAALVSPDVGKPRACCSVWKRPATNEPSSGSSCRRGFLRCTPPIDGSIANSSVRKLLDLWRPRLGRNLASAVYPITDPVGDRSPPASRPGPDRHLRGCSPMRPCATIGPQPSRPRYRYRRRPRRRPSRARPQIATRFPHYTRITLKTMCPCRHRLAICPRGQHRRRVFPHRARAAVPQLVSHAGVLLFAPVVSTCGRH